MKQAAWGTCALILLSLALLACGGSDTPDPNTPPVSAIPKRAFISNQFTGALDIADATNDLLQGFRVLVDPQPTKMKLSPDKTLAMVFSQGTNTLVVVAMAQEQVAGQIVLPDVTDSFDFLGSSRTVIAGVRNAGRVLVWDTSAGTVKVVNIANARWVVRGNNSKYVLVFPDDNTGQVCVFDVTATDPDAATAKSCLAGFDRPVWGVFASDDSKAWIMECGPQCGGTQAKVTQVNIVAGSPPTLAVAGSANVNAATYGILNSTTLFVGGTPYAGGAPSNPCADAPTLPCGELTVLNVSAATPVVSSTADIADGWVTHMLLTGGRLFIGSALTCSAPTDGVVSHGCLTLASSTGTSPVIVPKCGPECNGLNDVTGMAAISGRSVVYVIEGGEVRIYDTATGALTSRQIDTVGRSWDVVAPDP